MDNRTAFIAPHQPTQLAHAGYLRGFSFGGVFDGIVPHEILQWHHLLRGVGRAPSEGLRAQNRADGLFQAAMHVAAAGGIWKLLPAECAAWVRI